MDPAIDENTWRAVLGYAVRILDDLDARGQGTPPLTLGGGTVLMLRHRHRLSRDVDLFVDDVQWLPFFSARLNDLVERLALDCVEQANTVKLVFPPGDVDLIVAAPVTRTPATEILAFDGRTFRLETTAEILAKKLFHRAAHLQMRDVFDLVAVAEADPASATASLEATRTRHAVLAARLDHLARTPPDAARAGILTLGSFDGILPTMVETARHLLVSAARRP